MLIRAKSERFLEYADVSPGKNRSQRISSRLDVAHPPKAGDYSACDRMGANSKPSTVASSAGPLDAAAAAQACERGDGAACTAAGFCYALGTDGAAKDATRALELFERGCKDGDGQGCVAAGLAHRIKGPELDEGRAAEFFATGCNAGVARGCTALGTMYELGLGVEVDINRSIVLYMKACVGGDGEDCTSFGMTCLRARPQAPATAVEFFQLGCDRGNLRGCSNLGVLYDNGDGVTPDHQKAATLFEHACKDGRGQAEACGAYGHLLAEGTWVPKDIPRAAKLFTDACKQGVFLACEDFGILLERAESIPVDHARAVGSFQRACRGGIATACARARMVSGAFGVRPSQ